jgi:hypothetical protein
MKTPWSRLLPLVAPIMVANRQYTCEIPAMVVPADEISPKPIALGNDPVDVAGNRVVARSRTDLGVQGATTAGSGVETRVTIRYPWTLPL